MYRCFVLYQLCEGELPRWLSGKRIHLPMQVQSLGREDPLEKEMATYSSILTWEIPWTEESGRLQSLDSKKSWTFSN